MSQRIVLFELNEVPWRILDDIARERPDSHLATLLATGRSFATAAPDTALSPWITWPTVHRGVSDEEHTISDFGQDLGEVDTAYPPLWHLLVQAGVPVGIGGSLHTFPLPANAEDYAFYLPDVFASAPDALPRRLEAFQAFNLEMSRDSARNVDGGVPLGSAARFLAAAPRLGIRPRTALGLVRQLAAERRNAARKVRRRTWQSILAFDIFMDALERTRPAFATFFTNHVASSMHRYWAARYPDDYDDYAYTDGWRSTFEHEIGWTMARFDRMLGRVMDHARRTGAVVWVTSSMGQAATTAEVVKTQVQLVDVPRFLAFLGLPDEAWSRRPAMLPRVILKLDPAWRAPFARALDEGVEIGEHGPLPWKELEHGVFRLHPGTLFDVQDRTVTWRGRTVPFEAAGFDTVEIQDSANCNAYHVPEGSLVMWDPRAPAHAAGRPVVSTLDVAPSLLRQLGVTPPAHMVGDPHLSSR
jgi:hypothetical protein